MCGIAGILSYQDTPSAALVDSMVDCLLHRGPDDRGTFAQGPLAFGMRRLSIVDLGTGHQPIFNEDRTKVIIFNGEIYNYPELRILLLERGHQFTTTSDTEAILHLFEEYGEECLDYLQGMFAFAIWDIPRQELFIARDRFGIKPLFYHWNGSTLIFGSEIKSILLHPAVSRRLNPVAVDHYFSFLYVPDEHSLFSGIHKLRPGHCMKVKDRTLAVSRYYDLPAVKSDLQLSLDEWIDRFYEEATSVIRGHLLADVPLGAFLSGGIDSSLVVGIMAGLIDAPVETFAVGYDTAGASFDERKYARQVSRLFQTNHHELIVTPAAVAERLPELLEQLDEPFGDASVIPNYLLSEYTRKHVTVALSGLGGDEVCAGYERYLGATLAESHKTLTGLISNPVGRRLVRLLPDSRRGAHLPERLKRFTEHAALPLRERYYEFIVKFSDAQKSELFGPALRASMEPGASKKVYDAYWAATEGLSDLRRLLKLDLDTYLVDDLLALSDRCSMAHSIEMRVPFVDHKLVEFFWQVPDQLKLQGMSKKYLLRKAAERILPRDVIYRKKTGFSVPLSVWFRDALKPYLLDVLSESNIRRQGYLDPGAVQRIIDEHLSGARNYDEKLFGLLSFTVWHDKYF